MRNRTIINNVSPVLDGGKYYIKRIPGEEVTVTASIYCDGNDLVRAAILYKKDGEKNWQESPMYTLETDIWQGKSTLKCEGF